MGSHEFWVRALTARLRAVVLVVLAAAATIGAVAVVGPTAAAGATAASPSSLGARVGFAPGAPLLWEHDATLARELDAMAASGARWLRLDFDWPSIEPQRGAFNWSHTDRVVGAAQARGLKILALPTYTPSWARAAGTSDKHPPARPSDYAAFVAAAVERYAPRGISAWELWNEPNSELFWAPKPNPEAYTALLAAGAAAARTADPSATIISGGLAPAIDEADGTWISPTTFVRRMYAAGAARHLDAVAVHPYSYPALPLEPGTQAWNTFLRLPLVHDIMRGHGDGHKKIWLTEYGAPTGTGEAAVGEARQALLVTESLRALQASPWAGPLFWYGYRDQGTDVADREQNFGLVRHDFRPKAAWAAFRNALAAPAAAPMASGVAAGGGSSAVTARSIEDACPAGAPPVSRFPDVAPSDTHATAIDCISWWSITAGRGDGTYAPRAGVTRAEMATFIVRLIENRDGTFPGDAPDAFADDASTGAHELNINKLAAAGLVNGRGPGLFDPNALVTREQMATFLVRAYELRADTALEPGANVFRDVAPGSTHHTNINKAANAGFTSGSASGGFHPRDSVRRDQMASFLARVLDLLVEEGIARTR